jgi:hypothetical protein
LVRSGTVDFFAVDALKGDRRLGDRGEEERAEVPDGFGAAGEADFVESFERRGAGKDGMEPIGERTEEDVGEQNADGEDEGVGKGSETSENADGGGAPDGGGGIEAADVAGVLEDDTRAEETYAGDDVGDDAAFGGVIVRDEHAAHDKGGCSGADEGIGAGAGHALAPLSLKADERAECDGDEEMQRELERRDPGHGLELAF